MNGVMQSIRIVIVLFPSPLLSMVRETRCDPILFLCDAHGGLVQYVLPTERRSWGGPFERRGMKKQLSSKSVAAAVLANRALSHVISNRGRHDTLVDTDIGN